MIPTPQYFFEDLPTDIHNKVIILDIDGTLVPDNEVDCEPGVVVKIQALKKDNTIFLCSNSWNKNRTPKMTEQFGLQVLPNCGKKPNPIVLRATGAKPKNCVVIGDKYYTDYLLAKRTGARAIIVKRKYSGKETFKVKIIYLIDAIISHFV